MDLDMSKLYLDKTKDYLIEFQKMILGTTFDFMNINQENFDERVNYLLESIGQFFGVDRAYLFTVNNEENTIIYSHEWCEIGIKQEIGTINEIPSCTYPWWFEQLQLNEIVQIADVEDMPEAASAEQSELNRQEVKSLISVPVVVDDKICAFIGINTVRVTREWTKEEIEILHIMSNVLSQGLSQLTQLAKIKFMAEYDSLTGLPNRALFVKRLNQGILKANTQNHLISVLFINLDGFKRINDTLGYHQGDELLKQVAERLLGAVNQKESVCRTDGDQFILYLRDYKNDQEVDFIIAKIINSFNQPFVLRGEEYVITASMGLSQYPHDGEEVEILLESAYTAMHKAKSLEENHYLKFTEKIRNETREELILTNDLYYAIERNQMALHYQAQVNGVTGEIVGVEALLRWKHPEFGFVSPFKFIPLAEKTRLILPIGCWVLETACHQLKQWQRNGCKSIQLSVNFSAHQLKHPNVIRKIGNILEKTAVEPKYLEIEITESVAIDDAIQVKGTLKEIKNLGISLSIDDYGKQYSSLNRLKGGFMDSMKVDMSFIHGIGVNPKDEIIIKSILSLAADLDLETVAEGVETQEQVDFLNKTTCDRLQGYYFHKPMPADEMGKLLVQNCKK